MSSCTSCSGGNGNVYGDVEVTELVTNTTVPLPPNCAGPAPVPGCITPTTYSPPCVVPIIAQNVYPQNTGASKVMKPCCGATMTTPCSCEAQNVPYYAQTSVCAEDNTRTVINTQYASSIKNAAAFNIPACGQVAQVYFPGLTQIPLFSRVWAYGIGFLTVTSFDVGSQTVALRNDCSAGCPSEQAPVGTQVPACTQFVVTAADCSVSGGGSSGVSSSYPYVAAQFTAPAVSTCLAITVTNTNGLAVGKAVQIGGGTYVLQTITSATLITICNQGQGLPVGTVVNAQDGLLNYVTPIVLVDSNPCTSTPVPSGKLLVCKDNLQKPLSGTGNNQVPVYDSATGEVNFRDLLIPVGDCTSLTTCLILDPALPALTAYLVGVVNSAIFTVGELIVIQGTSFTVTTIVSPTQIRITPVVTPTAIQTYAIGTALCEADCCTRNQATITTQGTTIATHTTQINNLTTATQPCNVNFAGVRTALTVDTGVVDAATINNGLRAGTPVELVIQNTSTCRSMAVLYTFDHLMQGAITGGAGNEQARISTFCRGSFSIGGLGTSVANPLVVTAQLNDDLDGISGNLNFGRDQSFSRTATILLAPLSEVKIVAQTDVQHASTDSNSFNPSNLQARISAIGIAL